MSVQDAMSQTVTYRLTGSDPARTNPAPDIYHASMRVVVRQLNHQRMGEVHIEDGEMPSRVTITDSGQDVFLDWESACDDSDQLRRCIVCGSDDLFRHRTLPQITPIVIVLAFALSLIGVLGFVTDLALLIAMTGVLVVDIMILFVARTDLICYRCRSRYRDLTIAEYHGRWDRAVAARYRMVPGAADDRSSKTG